MYLSTSTSIFKFAKSKYKSKFSSKNIGKYSQVHRTFMFYNGEGQSDENTKAAVLCISLHVCSAVLFSISRIFAPSVPALSDPDYHFPWLHETCGMVSLIPH